MLALDFSLQCIPNTKKKSNKEKFVSFLYIVIDWWLLSLLVVFFKGKIGIIKKSSKNLYHFYI
jgi:hypothetical protein